VIFLSEEEIDKKKQPKKEKKKTSKAWAKWKEMDTTSSKHTPLG
jgi:hypothetical protein